MAFRESAASIAGPKHHCMMQYKRIQLRMLGRRRPVPESSVCAVSGGAGGSDNIAAASTVSKSIVWQSICVKNENLRSEASQLGVEVGG